MSTNQTKEWLSQQQIRQFFSQNKKEWFDSNFEIEHLLQHGSIEKTAIYLNDKHQDDTGYALVQADAEAFVAYLAAAKVESLLSMIDSDYHDNDLPKVIVMLNNYDIEKFSNLLDSYHQIVPSDDSNCINIIGSSSELSVNIQTGFIADGHTDIAISRFDVEELKAWCADELGEDVSPGDEFDILSIGYWTADGKHTAPEVDYRDEIKSSRCRP